METNFKAIKTEILRRAKEAHACTEQYGRAYKSETLAELMGVVKDNFHWACRNNVITAVLIEQYREDFATNDVYLNVSVERGYLLCDNATVEAYNSATVRAYDSATVTAYGSATVEAYNNATVTACDNATVKACGNATVKACSNATVTACDNATVKAYNNAYCTSYYIIECKLSENAIYRVRSTNTVYYASDDLKFVKQ